MGENLPTAGALAVLAQLYRERRSGVLSIGPGDAPLRVLLRDGQVVGLGPVAAPPEADAPLPRPDDSARIKLERVLQEIGIRTAPPKRAPSREAAPSHGVRERLLEALADGSLATAFEEGAPAPPDVAQTAGATEPLILEAVRQMRNPGAVREAMGDLDQRLVATTALAEDRTLTLTEGYLLSRIDGVASARQVLQLVPLDPGETERTLLGLLLTGRVEYRAAAAVAHRPIAVVAPADESRAPAEEALPDAEAPFPVAEDARAPAEAYPEASMVEEEASPAPSRPELDPETQQRRNEILEIFQSLPLKNHFEVLGVEPGCTDAEVKAAYVALAKRFHPDAHRDPRLEDLHDVLAKIFIRVAEAWEVLGEARSRASYEAGSGIVRRVREGAPSTGQVPPPPPATTRPPEPIPDYAYVPPEETLLKAQLLLLQARYWDAIQVLEAAVPSMQPRRHQNRGRILLAKAYAKNPNWVRRAEETLQDVVREDPSNVDAHYELGLIYKAGGLAARAQAMFRRVVELRPDHREAAAELGPGDGGGGLLKRLFGRGKAS